MKCERHWGGGKRRSELWSGVWKENRRKEGIGQRKEGAIPKRYEKEGTTKQGERTDDTQLPGVWGRNERL